jgi:uncharacterized cupredoxin-like copper-binding protein
MSSPARSWVRPRLGVIAAIALALASTTGALGADPSPAASPAMSMAAQTSAAVIIVKPGDPGFAAGTVDAPRPIALEVNDLLLFSPNVIYVQKGETIDFSVTNVGVAVHEFMVGPISAAFGDVEGTPEVADIAGGQTAQLTYTFDGDGPYAYACHAAGHYENGMFGFVDLSGPDVPAVGTTEQPRVVTVAMDDDLQFAPMDIPVTKGETVMFVLPNLGSAVHEFQVGPAGLVASDTVDGSIVVEVDEIEGRHVKSVTYTFDGDGPYAFACHEPGHFEAGMKGTITLHS